MDKLTKALESGDMAAVFNAINLTRREVIDAGQAGVVHVGVTGRTTVTLLPDGKINVHGHDTAAEASDCFEGTVTQAYAEVAMMQRAQAAYDEATPETRDLVTSLADQVIGQKITLDQARQAFAAARSASSSTPPTDRVGLYL